MQKYNKLWVALAGGIVQAVGLWAGVNSAWYVLVVAVLTAAGVYQVSNKA